MTKKEVEELSDSDLIIIFKELQNFIKYLEMLGSEK